MQPVVLNVFKTEKVLDYKILHKAPAFIGERYSIVLHLNPHPTYEISEAQISFTEEYDVDKKSSSSRRPSCISADSEGEPNDWNFLLFCPKTQSNYLSPDIDKQAEQKFNVSNIKYPEHIIQLFFQFRVDGEKSMAIKIRYTAKKVLLQNGDPSSDFTLETKDIINIEVRSPFGISCDWIAQDPYTNCSNSRQIMNGLSKPQISVGKPATLSVKISPSSFQTITIFDVKLKIKEANSIKMLENSQECNSKWKDWPIPISSGEMFSSAFYLVSLTPFSNLQVADVEILWSRSPESERYICSIPISEVSSNEAPLEIHVDLPYRIVQFCEFSLK